MALCRNVAGVPRRNSRRRRLPARSCKGSLSEFIKHTVCMCHIWALGHVATQAWCVLAVRTGVDAPTLEL
eukprot:7296674-Prymnesium_polylepis.1